jgi:ubiquinone/menaquinone biosynthesis C-methylase UbiE
VKKERAGQKASPANPTGYLHGYTPEEQDRLYAQARFLEPVVYDRIDLYRQRNLLEVGCGVGAQSEILLRRFPDLKIQGIDISEAQVARARERLATDVQKGRVAFDAGDATRLPYPDQRFDGAFLCWFLEHVQKPVEILREIHRTLQPEAVIYCSEVMNATFFLHPYSPATLKFWFEFNDHQWTLGGDPFVGAKLANYLRAAGFRDIISVVKTFHYDNRSPQQRSEFFEYWTNLLLSGAPSLLEANKVTPEAVEEMKAELQALKNAQDAVFFYSFIQARAVR